jgi:hypothetical protein
MDYEKEVIFNERDYFVDVTCDADSLTCDADSFYITIFDKFSKQILFYEHFFFYDIKDMFQKKSFTLQRIEPWKKEMLFPHSFENFKHDYLLLIKINQIWSYQDEQYSMKPFDGDEQFFMENLFKFAVKHFLFFLSNKYDQNRIRHCCKLVGLNYKEFERKLNNIRNKFGI